MPLDAPFLASDVDDIHPLTPLQRGMLFNAVEYGGDVFVEQIAWTLTGPLDVPRLQRAWEATVRRHGALRSVLRWEGLTQPYQIVLRGAPPSTRVRTGAPPCWRALEAEERAALPDLRTAPPTRMLIVALGDDKHRLIWTVHHVILDGWSAGAVLADVAAAYATPDRPLDPAPQFSAFTAWATRHVETAGARNHHYWRARFRALSSPFRLALFDTVTPSADTTTQDHLDLHLTEAESDRLRETARRHGVTLAVLLQGAVAVLLSRYTGRRDVCFGTVASLRPPAVPFVTDMVGMFVGTLPAILSVPADLSLTDWLQTIARLDAEGREHGLVSLADLARLADVDQVDRLFDVLMVVENMPGQSIDGEPTIFCGCRADDERIIQNPRQPLALIFRPGRSITVRLSYQPARFSATIITQIGRHLRAVLDGMTDPAASDLDGLPMLSPEETAALVSSPRADTAPTPGSPPFPSPPDLLTAFQQSVARTPDAPAVTDATGTWTYAALDAEADLYHRALAARGVTDGHTVGLFVQKGRPMLAALIGLFRTGATYLPLDVSYPPQRLAIMIRVADCRCLVTDGTTDHDGLSVSADQCLSLSALREQGERLPPQAAAPSDPARTAFIVFTSGSTGIPKGMPLPHAGLCEATTVAARLLRLTPRSRFLSLSSPCFDIGTSELFIPLVVGASLVILPREETRPGETMQSVLRDHRITATFCTPSVLRTIAPRAVPDLRAIMVGGEVLPRDLAEAWRDRDQFANIYGPAEGCIFVTDTDGATGEPLDTIGAPRQGCAVYVLDGDNRLLPPGVPGELCLASTGLADGYVGDPELTAARFVANPFHTPDCPDTWRRMYRTGDLGWWDRDGWLHFVGRADTQVKIDGVRIEVEEVEAVLRRLEGIRDAAVVATARTLPSRPSATTVLGAFLLADDGDDNEHPDESRIRGHLLDALPAAAIPSLFQWVTDLPMGGTGKLDRRALEKSLGDQLAAHQEDGDDAPRGDLETQLAAVWRDVLGVGHIGRRDHFFRLGGDSIKALQVIAKARKNEMDVSADDLFRYPELSALAQRIATRLGQAEAEAEAETEPEPIAPAAQDHGSGGPPPRTLSHGQAWLARLSRSWGDGPLWHTTAGVVFSGDLDPALFREATETVLARHPALRMGCRFENAEPVGFVAETARPEIRFCDLRHAGGEEAARHIAAAAFAEPLPLDRPPLLRVLCLRLTETDWAWTIIFHRFIADPATRALVFRETSHVYQARLRGVPVVLPPAPPFTEFMTRDGAPGPLRPVPSASERPPRAAYAPDRTARRRLVSLPAPLARDAQTAARACGETEYALLTAAMVRTLLDWTGQEVLTIATPFERRTESTRHMAGPVSEDIHLTLSASALERVERAVRAVSDARTAAMHLSGPSLAQHLQVTDPGALERPDAGAPIVISHFNTVSEHGGDNDDEARPMRQWSYPRYTSPHDLVLVFWRDGDALSLLVEHRLASLPEDRVPAFVQRFQDRLQAFCATLIHPSPRRHEGTTA